MEFTLDWDLYQLTGTVKNTRKYDRLIVVLLSETDTENI